MYRRGDAGDETVGASRPDQGHTRGQPITANAPWNRNRAQVEKIDEVGIGPKPGIETNGIGLDLGDGVQARRCRNQHRVEFRPDAACLPLLIRKPIKGLESGYSIELVRALDNRTGDRKQRFRIVLDQRLGRGVSLRDPWALVERLRDFGERLEVKLDDPGAERCGKLNVARERVRGGGVIEELPLIRAGNPQANPAWERGERRVGKRAAVSISLVESARRLKDCEGVGDIASENRDGVERPAGRDDAGRGKSAERRFETHNAIKRRGHAPRSRGVGAECKRNKAGANGNGRAGAGPSG